MLLWGVAFIFSTTFHEAAHAWTAKKGGDDTAYLGGQVTMNPWPHIRRSPFGMVIIPLLCFAFSGFMIGWASTPYDPRWASRYPHRSALMSLAGPTANLIVVIASFVLLKIGLSAGVFQFSGNTILVAGNPVESIWHPIANLVSILYFLNIILLVFNLIPLPPLDGAEGILLLFPENKADSIRQNLNTIGIFGIFIAWLIFNKIAGPVLGFMSMLL